jgi:hypothetical protein
VAVQTSVKVENNEGIAGTGVFTPELGSDKVAEMACCYGQPVIDLQILPPLYALPRFASQARYSTVAAGDPERLQIFDLDTTHSRKVVHTLLLGSSTQGQTMASFSISQLGNLAAERFAIGL